MTRGVSKVVVPESPVKGIAFMKILRVGHILDFVIPFFTGLEPGAFHGFRRETGVDVKGACDRWGFLFSGGRLHGFNDVAVFIDFNALTVEIDLNAAIWPGAE